MKVGKPIIPQSVLKKARKDSAKVLRAQVDEAIQREFNVIKEQMIREFLNLPITQEIMGGSDSTNISGTLGGYGNLFSFIGFEKSDKPIDPILDLLESSSITVREGADHLATITIPSAASIFSVTPMPWASGRSWAKGIESGISGLGFYINKSGVGRSTAGIQTSKKIKGGTFKRTQYISTFIQKYIKQFSSIQSSQLNLK
jgi:hypothetical protein